MKRWIGVALAAGVVMASLGCAVQNPQGKPHPHGAPPGQVKKAMYRCGTCNVVREAPGSCHGASLILVP
jgi:hypothetical protein